MMIFLEGKAFREMTSCTGGDRILISVTLNGALAFSETTCWIGGDAIEVSLNGKDGKTCNEETCCICGEGIEQDVMGCEIGGLFSILSILFRCS